VQLFSAATTFVDKPAMFTVLTDSTPRRQAELNQTEAEQLNTIIVRESPLMMLVHDGEIILGMNPATVHFFECADPPVMVGTRIIDLVHPESYALLSARLEMIRSISETSVLEYDFTLPNGKVKSIYSHCVPIQFKNRPAYLSILQDLTETKQIHTRYKNLFDSAPLGIAVVNPEGELIKANHRMAKIFGYPSPEAFIRETATEFGQHIFANIKDHEQLCHQTFTRGEAHNDMCQSRRRDGSLFWTSISATVIKDVVYRPVSCKLFIQDITNRRLAEDEATERGRRIRTLSAEMTLAHEQERRHLAHELHDGPAQLLALVTMMLGDLAERTGQQTDFDVPLKLLREAALQLCSNISDLAPPALFAVDLAQALEKMRNDFQARHSLAVDIACQDLPELSKDAASFLFRTMRELLVNAVKHGRANWATIQVKTAGGRLTLEVEDNGQGFTPDISGDQRPGSMGLPSLGSLARDLGGSLKVDSTPGTGTRVALSLPLDTLCIAGKSTFR